MLETSPFVLQFIESHSFNDLIEEFNSPVFPIAFAVHGNPSIFLYISYRPFECKKQPNLSDVNFTVLHPGIY